MPCFSCFPCCRPAPPPTLKLHVDADRDGIIDPQHTGLDVWTPGVGQRGAILIANVDDDDGTRAMNVDAQLVEDIAAGGGLRLDGHNEVVDTAADREFSLLSIRRYPTARAFPGGWTARLSVSHPARVRIFRHVPGPLAVVLGPANPGPYVLPAPIPAQIDLRMEAVGFPDHGFSPGEITLTLDVLDGGGAVQQTHIAVMRVAPWILPHHLCAVTEVFVLGKVGIAPNNVEHVQFNVDLANAVAANNAAPPLLTQIVGLDYGYDVWCRDVMSLGFTSHPRTAVAPGAGWHLPVVMRTPSNRGAGRLDRVAWRAIAGIDVGYVAPVYPPIAPNDQNSFGNLLVSPPVTVAGRQYPFGRLIYGRGAGRMSLATRRFLAAQVIQAPIEVNTRWLSVGHVDEIFTFVPAPLAPRGFRLVIASPAAAITLMQQTRLADGAPADAYPLFPPARRAALGNDDLGGILADAPFVQMQADVQAIIDDVKDDLVDGLNLAPAEIIHIPVLFHDDNADGQHDALTGDSANMLVVTKANGRANLIIPKPFGPHDAVGCIFERNIGLLLAPDYPGGGAAQSNITFVDDFVTYHENMGEIHCGTNEKRAAPVGHWWWETPWL